MCYKILDLNHRTLAKKIINLIISSFRLVCIFLDKNEIFNMNSFLNERIMKQSQGRAKYPQSPPPKTQYGQNSFQ